MAHIVVAVLLRSRQWKPCLKSDEYVIQCAHVVAVSPPDGQDVVHEKKVMAWSTQADPLLYEMDYENKRLVIQKEGYYYVYSKVSFVDVHSFTHSVSMKTQLYKGESIPLLLSTRSSRGSSDKQSSSYLAGVFHFYKNDAVFVEVSNTSHIVRSKSYENVFGAYMI